MVCFPQLLTGGVAQYPLVRRRRRRSIVNETLGGGRVTWPDVAAESLEWELPLAGLTESEREAIEELFEACGGRAENFVFLDPLDNLLGWSEDLEADAWTVGPMLECTAGMPDPFGTTGATKLVNTAQAPQRLSQTLGAPGWFNYCFSVRVRSANTGSVKLVVTSEGREQYRVVTTGTDWREAWLPAKLGGANETIACGIELAPGASVDVFGFQLEAQIGPSTYKRTAGRGGVYPAARFIDDLLRLKTDGADWHSTTIRITSRREGA